jgi:hypothetical protein
MKISDSMMVLKIVIGYEFLFPAGQTAVVQETMAPW